MFTFRKTGRKDYMGFNWFAVYLNGKPVMEQGVHLKYHALDMDHAREMHEKKERVAKAKQLS